MARIGKYGVLNVVMHPHPAGAYRRLFDLAGKDPNGVRFFGDRFATLSPISETRNGVFSGRLATWTEIDPDSNLIEKRSLKEQLLADAEIDLPEGVGFNSKVFTFAFREADHRLYVELKNDENQTISIGRACQAIAKVLESIRPIDVDEIDVYVSTRSNAVEHVLSIPKLRKVVIQLDLPNPDGLSDEKQALLDEIDGMHAKRLRAEVTRAAGHDTLILSERYRVMAELAPDNGFVKSSGKDDLGSPLERSTKEYPNEIEVEVHQDQSRAITTRHVAERGDDAPPIE